MTFKNVLRAIKIMLLFLLKVNAIINPHGPTVTNDVIKCIVSLIDKNFDTPGLLIFGKTDNQTTQIVNVRTEILKHIHESLKYTVQILIPSEMVEVCDEDPIDLDNVLFRDPYKALNVADYYVLVTENFQDFVFLAGKLIQSRTWNPFAKFIIFLISSTYNNNESIETTENILDCLFKYYAVNIIVAVLKPGTTRNILIYSWKPYDPPRFCGYLNETARNRLILENTCEHGVIKNNTLLFYNKVPDDMMNCALNILAIKRQPFVGDSENDPNIEKTLVNKILGSYNFTTTYKVLNDFRGERNKHNIWDGALSKLLAKNGDILLGGIFPDYDVHEDFECSNSYLADSYAWVVPRADPSPPWVQMTITFKTVVWCSIVAGFVICVLSWKILGDMSNESMYHKSFMHSFLNTYIITLGFSAYVRPVKQSLRLFFVALNLYCVILLTAYQTKLIQVVQMPIFENQLNNLDELVESGLKFGGTEELHDLYSNSSDAFDIVIKENWIDVDNISSALIDVAVHRNFSVLCSRLELAHLSAVMPELNDCFGNLKYFTFESNTFSVPAEMIARKGFPFMKKFSKTLGVFMEIGINEGIRRSFARLNSKRRTRLLLTMNVRRSNFTPLSTIHLQGGFYALCLGYISGSLVLLIEIIVNTKLFKTLYHKTNKIMFK